MNSATTSFQLKQIIEISYGGARLMGEIVKMSDKAICIETINTHGEWKPFVAKVWFPKSAIAPRPLPKDPKTREYFIANRMNENRFILASWFRPDAEKVRLFNCADADLAA